MSLADNRTTKFPQQIAFRFICVTSLKVISSTLNCITIVGDQISVYVMGETVNAITFRKFQLSVTIRLYDQTFSIVQLTGSLLL